jgi:hypothetical protein
MTMRILERNKQDIWYANPTGMAYATDNNGLKTGEKIMSYGIPVKTRMSMAISSGANNLGSQGMATVEPYGIVTGYTHRAVTEDLNCPMGEQSHVWFGIVPAEIHTVARDIDGETVDVEETVNNPHNFVVVRKAKSLNHLIYYLKEVDVQ